jgi:deoxyinosine 3'endonuclease (endonuclease V)
MKAREPQVAIVCAIGIASRSKAPVREAVSHKDDHKQRYICGFLMLMNRKCLLLAGLDYGVRWADSERW